MIDPRLKLDALTELQDEFVNEYAIDLDRKAAAIRCGYEVENALSIADRILSYPQVRVAVAERLTLLEDETFTSAKMKRAYLLRVIEVSQMVAVNQFGEVKMADAKAVISAVAELNKMSGDYAPTKTLIGEDADNPVSDLMKEIANNAKNSGPLRLESRKH